MADFDFLEFGLRSRERELKKAQTARLLDATNARATLLDLDASGALTSPTPDYMQPAVNEYQRHLENQAFPDARLAAMQNKAFPAKPTFQKFGNGEGGGMVGPDGSYTQTVAPTFAPAKPSGPESALGKLNADFKAGLIDKPTYDAQVAKENRVPLDPSSRPWRIMNPDEVKAARLPDGGTYKTNGIDFQVITQPKQEKPTQGENTAAYHARRIANGLGTLSEIINGVGDTKGNPDAVTSLVPGNNPVSKSLRSDNENRIQSVLPEIGDALLTLGTGAAYTKEQFDNQWSSNLPAVGDSDKVKADKFGRIQALYEQAKTNAGPMGIALPDFAPLAAIYQNRADNKPKPPPRPTSNGRTGAVVWERGPDGKPRPVSAQ